MSADDVSARSKRRIDRTEAEWLNLALAGEVSYPAETARIATDLPHGWNAEYIVLTCRAKGVDCG